MKQLYFLDMDAQSDVILDAAGQSPAMAVSHVMAESLPAEKKERLQLFRNGIDRKIALYSEILLRCLLSVSTGIGFRETKIQTDPLGKPYLMGGSGIEFNVSHTRCAAAVALSDVPVGVDIERVREIDFGIAPAVFSEGEMAFLNASQEERSSRFFDIWTKKEARLKRSGVGLSGNLKDCDVTVVTPGEALFTARAGAYIISVCAGMMFDDDDLIKLTELDLFTMWRRYAN